MNQPTLVVILSSCFLMGVMCVEKRSDDLTLSTVVQQQAAVIQQLQAKLDSLTMDLHGLTSKVDTKVYFNAGMQRTNIAIGTSNSPLLFDAVLYNVGNAYNPHSGVFTAPISGVYVFHAYLLNDGTHGWMQWGIAKGSSMLCYAHLQGTTEVFDSAACQTAVHMQQGETVVVHRTAGDDTDQVIYGWNYCSFGGFLLSAD